MASGDPRTALAELIGAWFHQDAFADGAASIDKILDEYVAAATPRDLRDASRGAHELRDCCAREQHVEAAFDAMGFAFVPARVGFDGYMALLAHFVERLDRVLDEAPAEAFDDDEPAAPSRVTDGEAAALSAALESLGARASGEAEIARLAAAWSCRSPSAAGLAAARAARGLRESPLLDEELLAQLRDLGLGFDVVDQAGIGLNRFLEVLERELTPGDCGAGPVSDSPDDGSGASHGA
jgi:hypothetical protein